MTPRDIEKHIVSLEKRFRELEAELTLPETYAKPELCRTLSGERRNLEKILNAFSAWTKVLSELEQNRAMLQTETDPEFRELVQSDIDQNTESAVRLEQELLFSLIPPAPHDGRGTIVEIRPGAGGEEAALFAGEIFRAYTKFAERKGWKLEVLDLSETDLGGVKEAVFSLAGEDVFSFMKYESGVHRVQRVPSTEASGRIHTSTITVAVLPEADELDEIEVKHEDLEISTFRSSGPGGQNVNRTDSAVRMVHKPTGITVASQQERSQIRNREICLRILKAKLLEIRMRDEAAKQAADKRSQIGTGDRSERIRTYNFPQNRITDHRFGVSTFDLPGLMEGDFDQVLTPIREIEKNSAVQKLLENLSAEKQENVSSRTA